MYHELGKSVEENEGVSSDAVEMFKKSGKIAAEMLDFGKKLIKVGASPLSILDQIEEKIREKGALPAFPPQISLNDTAAHSCPDDGDESVFGEDVVKLDVGVHVDGYVSDNAVTIDLSGKWTDLIKADQEALKEAIKLATPGTKIAEIGKTVQEVLEGYGFSPVRNLSGHGIGRYKIHTKPSIPNFDTGDPTQLVEGMAIAIEPFASTGAGVVYESGDATVFMFEQNRPIRDPISRKVLNFIDQYEGLPFAKKWLTREFGKGKTSFALRKLTQFDILHAYPPLVDQRHGMIAQAEKSVIVSDKPIVITQI